MPWFRSAFIATALTLACCTAYAQTPAPATSDASSSYGWLEGTLTTEQGNPVQEASNNYAVGKSIKLLRHSGGSYTVSSDMSMGGFYSDNRLKPGIYDISVTTGYWGNTGSQPYRPQHILGVLIKPGQKTRLDIVMPLGSTLQETGQSSAVSESVTNVNDELARMQKQIDDLKQQVATLLKATANAVPAPATGKP